MTESSAAAESAAETAKRPPRERSAAKRRPPGTLPPHVVVLHNDPHNSMLFVVTVLRKVLDLPASRAVRFMAVAHKSGRCAVWSGHRELAELKAQQIVAAGADPVATASGEPAKPLRVTVEPAPGD